MSTAAPVPAEALERCFAIDCAGERLPAILHPGTPGAARGVLVVVGGPQTRVGSHRQFVLLARQLAVRRRVVRLLLQRLHRHPLVMPVLQTSAARPKKAVAKTGMMARKARA